MAIRDILGKQILFFDGGMGTMLQKNGMKGGEIPELININNPDLIKSIHTQYLNAGADIITTNSFGANPLKLNGEVSAEAVAEAAVKLAKEAVNEFKKGYVAFDIGPTGKLLEPTGELSFDDAYESFKSMAIVAENSGADLVIIETMSDTLEAKAAVLAVKENTNLPIFLTMTFDETHKTLTGADVDVMSAMFEGLGVDCL